MNPEMQQQLLDQVRTLEESMRAAASELESAMVTGRSADGTVTVLASALGRLKAVQVDPVVFARRDVQALEQAIAEAIREAGRTAGEMAQQVMGDVEITLH